MNRKLIILLLIGFIFISGIQGCEKKQSVKEGYLGGTDGLGLNFAEGEPPESVLDANTDPFIITLLLKNKGEYDIPESGVIVTLTGINKDAFQIGDLTKRNEDPISKSGIEQGKVVTGGQDEISYDAKYRDDLPTDFIQTIGANVCYRYSTGALAKLCLRKGASERARDNDVCIIYEDKGISNSGAPVQIMTLSERPAGTNKVRVIFEIENKGKGVSYLKDTFSGSACLESGNRDNENKVNVLVSSDDDVTITCNKLNDNAEGEVRLVENKVILSCDIDTSRLQDTTFISPLKINLDYMYKDFISKQIKIENAVV